MGKATLTRVVLLLVCTISFSILFAQKKVTGIVKNDMGIPLVGATVTAKNTKVATTTDANGAFSIDVPQNSNTLVISYVGMERQEVGVSKTNTINISLVPASTSLTDVVVIGYGKTKKSDLSSAVGTV